MLRHLLRSASSDFTAKARYVVGEESAEMRIDTAGLFNLYTRFMIKKIEHSRVRYSRSQSDKENQKRFLKHKLLSILETKKKKNRYIHIENVKKQQQHLYILYTTEPESKSSTNHTKKKLSTNTTKN